MTFKPAIWRPIAFVLCAVNLVSVPFTTPAWHSTTHAVLALAFGLWAQRLGQRAPVGDVGRMQELLDEQTDALEDARAVLSGQSAQLAELQERVDFAERLLVQQRERQVLRKPEEHA